MRSWKAGILAGAAAVLVLGGTVVYDAGAVRMSVQEKKANGQHICLLVPALLLTWGVKLAPREKLREACAEIRPWLPAIKVASQELAREPDGPLVEVEEPRERVSIKKRGDSLVIDVNSEHEAVHLSFPLRAVASAAAELASDGRAN